jgi:hypothetical protein
MYIIVNKNIQAGRNHQLIYNFDLLFFVECQKALIESVFKASTKTQLVEIFAENLMTPLSSSSTFTIDNQSQCSCDDASLECDSGVGNQSKIYGNTNIGKC